MASVVAVEARYDAPTRAAYEYRNRHIYQALGGQVSYLRVLRGPLARRTFIVPELSSADPELLVAVGHGDGDTMMGYGGATIFERGIHDASEVAGRIVHLLACETAQELGRHLIEQGAAAFIGYDWQVMLERDVFDAFMECDSTIDLELLSGRTVAQAHRAAIRLFDEHIDRLRAAGKLFDAAVMATNRDSLRSPLSDLAFGQPNAHL